MKVNIVYLFGLFENHTDSLFTYLKKNTVHIEWCGIELYPESEFGSYSFAEEMKRIQTIIDDIRPDMLVAHSLGAYVSAQLVFNCPVVFLEPSLAISDIVLPNTKHGNNGSLYDDGKHKVKLSTEFVESIKLMPSIKELAYSSKLSSEDVCIIGAGKGGHIIARQYCIPSSRYVYFPNANHMFSGGKERRKILSLIKKRLDIIPGRVRDVCTISP
ncbi:MAG: hypothetical protein HYS59_01615 [Candidatus Vogelbacteria bacterium]|nr:hypothetical protein [Candidatus Vogelbacteria bacterium]